MDRAALFTGLLVGSWFLSSCRGGVAGGGSPLPRDWVTYRDQQGRTYYYNQVDGRRQWEPPGDLAATPQTAGVGAVPVSDRYYTALDSYGRTYWVDRYTGLSSYESPMIEGGNQQVEEDRTDALDGQGGTQPVDVGVLQETLAQMEEERDKLREQLRELEEAHASTVNSTLLLKDELETSKKEVKALTAEKEVLVGEMEELNKSKEAAAVQIEGLLNELSELRSKKESEGKELEEAYERERELESAYRDAMEQIKRLEDAALLQQAPLIPQQQEQPPKARSWREQQPANEGQDSIFDDDEDEDEDDRPSLLSRVLLSSFRSIVPKGLLGPSKEDVLEMQVLNRTVMRLRENATALLEVIQSRNSLIDELHQRIEMYEDEQLRRRKTVASLREAISELTEEVNSKGEELLAMRGELKKLLQEVLWRDANVTAMDTRVAMSQKRIKDLEGELSLALSDKSRALETAAALSERLKEAQSAREGLGREVEELKKQAEQMKKRSEELLEEVADRALKIGSLQQEVGLLEERLAEREEELARRERERQEQQEARLHRDEGGTGGEGAAGAGEGQEASPAAEEEVKPPEPKKTFCWFGYY